MNIIFLDVQGVLTSRWYKNKQNRNINPKKIKLLKTLIDKTNSQIVLISNWRKYYQKEEENNRYKLLEENLKKKNLNIYDRISDYDENYPTRSSKVYKYIKENKIDNYVILDDRDQNWKEYNLENNFVQTNNKKGLTRKNIKQAIKIIEKTKN